MPNFFIIMRLLRPRHWIKNAFVFAPILFSLQYANAAHLFQVVVAAAEFVLLSSAGYIFNDLRDAESDRDHPEKKNRPIAAYDMTRLQANRTLGLLLILAIPGLFLLPLNCAIVTGSYAALTISYSLFFKKIALLDVTLIALGFVLRVLMGGYAAEVVVSPWIIEVTFLLALFLGFGKRYHELAVHPDTATRPSLQHYSIDLLDRLMVICASATLLSYSIYAVETAARLHENGFVYSTGFVAFGLFRYLQHMYVFGGGGAPEQIVFRDRIFVVNLGLWLLFCLWQLATAQG